MPTSFLPDYKKLEPVPSGDGAKDPPAYTFSYNVKFVSQGQKITYVSAPEGSTTCKDNETEVSVKLEKSTKVPRRQLSFYYRVQDMLYPQLNYAVSEKDDEVACLVNFVPTFAPVEPQEIVFSHEMPEEQTQINGKDFLFIFLIDRSGSMGGQRIELAKEALILFI